MFKMSATNKLLYSSHSLFVNINVCKRKDKATQKPRVCGLLQLYFFKSLNGKIDTIVPLKKLILINSEKQQ